MLFQLFVSPTVPVLRAATQQLLYERLAALRTVTRVFHTGVDYLIVDSERII